MDAIMKLVCQRDFLLRKFGVSLEWLVLEMSSGHPPEGTILLDGKQLRDRMAALGGLKNDGESVGGNKNLPKMENLTQTPMRRTTENTTTTETINDKK